MIHCLNPDCAKPRNPDSHRFCQQCGWRLQLGDRYEAAYPVGPGQNSRTYIGRDRATLVDSQCLIKQFTPFGNTLLEQEASAERFRKDVDHLTIASQHSQLPDLLASFERDKHQFLVQQFLQGPHLDQRLQEKRGPFSSKEVRTFLKDVLPVLHYLHRNRIIHRDIKPTNFRCPPGQSHWWLVDLGVIKPMTATRMARPGTVVGSADYVSPEQLRGEATYASDVYSLGVVCLHLLTGLPPFDLFDSLNGWWQWRSIVPDVQPDLANLIDQMVQPALRDRIATVEAVMSALGMDTMTVSTLSSPVMAAVPNSRWMSQREIDLKMTIVDAVPVPSVDHLLLLKDTPEIEVRSLTDPANCLSTLRLEQAPSAVVLHPAEPIFLLGTRQGTVEKWSWSEDEWQGQALLRLSQPITQLLFTADGQELLVTDEQGSIHRWNWQARTSQVLKPTHRASIASLAISHSGTLLASGDTEGQIKIWHLPTGDCLRTLSRQPGAITALAWLANDQALVTAGWDVAVHWRDPETGGILKSVKAEGFYLPVRSLLSHPTQPDIIIGTQDGHMQCWRLNQQQGIGSNIERVAIAPQQSAPILALRTLSADVDASSQLFSATATGLVKIWSTFVYPS
ncbi:serine/threonine-protein kinase [Oscillatoria sp. CS-180]|uniref:serine/threonine-protein kinase n=1 Tax=Oscillatoria sp. CS-180 TaxID=3021720 RepID=UPI00232C7C30|nr:serine/threonine-protein kinase [Oscillatoria sp. CS-180]MDB9527699.1 serine/threonine-protein kinase [Oscillatoria sp. CS-180]